MYKPKKHIRLDSLRGLPKMSNMRTLLTEARNAKGCTVELPWRSVKTELNYSMTVRVEMGGGEPIWTLYEGDGTTSRVMWSSPFEDLDLLYDVVCLSLPADVITAIGADEFVIAQPSRRSDPEPVAAMPGRPDSDEPFFAKPQESESEFPKFPKPVDAPAPAAPAPVAQPQQPAQQPAYYPQQPYPPHAYPPGYGYPPGYAQPPYPYPPQGYGYPPGYPPGYGMPQVYIDPRTQQPYTAYPYPPYPQPAQTVPVQQGAPYSPPSNPPRQVPIDNDLIKKRPNVLLGNFLVDAGLIPDTTLNSALQLQEMVRSGSLTTTQAAEAVRRAHNRGGALEQNMFSASPPRDDNRDAKAVAPPLGQILVETGLISIAVLKAALNLQEVVRTGAMTKEDAVEAFIREHFGLAGKHGTSEPAEAVKAIDLVKKTGLLQEQDFQAAVSVKLKHGGEVAKILAAAGKLDTNTYEAAVKCNELMEQGRLKMEQAIIALHYCQRSRAAFDDAVEEMGWEKP
jgi:hypothetical protein